MSKTTKTTAKLTVKKPESGEKVIGVKARLTRAEAIKTEAPKAKESKVEKILDQIEAETDLKPAARESPDEIVKEVKISETLSLTSAAETPATDPEPTQTEAEREYGESTLDLILSALDTFKLAVDTGLELSVIEAIYRRLVQSGKAPSPTKSTFKATEGGVGPTKRVWEIAASMRGAKRSKVLAVCLREGIGINTAKTQYQRFMEAGRGKITGR